MSWKRACLGALALLIASTGSAIAQEPTRTISGTVKEAVTGESIAGAYVVVQGTTSGALTELDGSFTIADVPMAPVVLEITSAGHQDATVPVDAGQAQVTIELSPAEVIVVTGRAPELFRKNLANGASTVRGDDITQVPSSTLDGALQGKTTGINIQQNSGAPGGGIQVSMRGVSTISGRTDILYVIDGVIVSDVAIASGINAVTQAAAGSNASNQDNPANRIGDLNPNDIASVEILKGASAAALYGSKASNGVVIITTKRGRAGKPKVTVTQRLGTAQVSNKLGARVWANEQAAIDAFGDNIGGFQVSDLYVEDGNGAGYVQHDHEGQIMQSTFASETSATLSGGTETTRYLVSASIRDEPGIIIGTGYEKQTARLAIDQDFGKRLKVSVTSNFMHTDTSRGISNNDNNSVSHYMVLSFTPNFLDLRAYDDGSYPINPFVGPGTNPLQTVALMSDSDDVWRNITSLNANLDAWERGPHAIKLTATLGLDRFQSRGKLLFPRELIFEPVDDGLAGTAIATTSEARKINWGTNLLYAYTPAHNKYKSVSSIGVYYDENKIDVLRVVSEGLAAGPGTIDTGVSVQTQDTRLLERDQSIALQEELLVLDERLSVLVALLADRSSNNGDSDKFFYYPKASAAYRVPTEGIQQINLLRARAAFGETGNKPAFGQKFTNLAGGNTIGGIGGIGITGVAGNPAIKPERQRELELGVDMSALDGRALVEFTLYNRQISDLILPRAVAPSSGFTTQIDNIASMNNRGVELMLQVTPVRRNDFQWLSRTMFSLNRSEITELGVPAFNVGGFGVSLGAFRIEEGASATQIVGNSPDSDVPVVVGDAEPDFRVSFVNDFTWKDLTLHTLFDWQQGSNIINLTRLLYDFGQNSVDFVDEAGMGSEGTGAWRLDQWLNGDTSVYIEDASFLKLREISLSYKLPRRVTDMIGPMDEARLSVSGRNLLTFTNYSGLDPEVSNFGRQSIARNIDVAPYPPNRSFWFSVEASF